MSIIFKPQYIWIVNTDSHGTVGYWTTRKGAIHEVLRLFHETYENGGTKLNIRNEEDFIDAEDFYGVELVFAVRVELNCRW